MKNRDARIFTRGINDTVEPTEYLWGVIKRVNRNILEGRDHHEGITEQEIKDLITYHIDSYVISFKTSNYANMWLEKAREYNLI